MKCSECEYSNNVHLYEAEINGSTVEMYLCEDCVNTMKDEGFNIFIVFE